MTAAIAIDAAGESHIGQVRQRNEDAFLVAPLLATAETAAEPEVIQGAAMPGASITRQSQATLDGTVQAMLLAVADGVGGSAAGDIASRTALERVAWSVAAAPAGALSRADGAPTVLRDALMHANAALAALAQSPGLERGLATTLTAALLVGSRLHVAHVGDSRAYLVRGGIATQLTRDDSLVQQLVERGELTPDEAARSERKNIILQAVGTSAALQPQLSAIDVEYGDLLVLCTDGVTNVVDLSSDAAAPLLRGAPARICEALVGTVLTRGAPDNVTIVAAAISASAPRTAAGTHRSLLIALVVAVLATLAAVVLPRLL